ncbi:major Facilitator Superfamily protein [Rutstroemia sp. NJR-2017a BVV2]|nr:major Facilitator Superfamily protein [Rutstroemia sp. NJR-2017a BVV2]
MHDALKMNDPLPSERNKSHAPDDTPASNTMEETNTPATEMAMDTSQPSTPKEKESQSYLPQKSLGFWAIIFALCAAGLLTALEATITSTALPTIVDDLGGADLYVWIVNGFFLAMTAFQPLFGQVADIFGRRWPMLFATAAFVLGCGICGGASSAEMLVAGRVIQGLGAGGVNVLLEIIVCDILPLRERGKFLAPIFGIIALGTALGPFFGGLIVQNTSWRWVFYLNLPIGGVALVFLFLFLNVHYDKETHLMDRLKRIDWIGNIIFVLAMVSILIALSWAGSKYPWSSFRILVPLILGLLGLVGFLAYEASPWCVEPTMPLHLFTNRTSTTAYALTFLHSIATISAIYFLPIYFQGVRSASPARSGVDLLPTILFLIPAAITAGGLLSTFGRYRPLHHAGFAIMVIGFGLFSLLNANSSTAAWVIFQAIEACGAGVVLPVLLPAVQAALTDADTALATATWAFVRSFGLIWGATIPAAVFNTRFAALQNTITDPAVVAQLSGGQAYQRATKKFLDTITDPVVKGEVIEVFSKTLKTIWYVSIAFVALGFVLVNFEKEIPLRKELDTDFGMVEKKKADGDQPVSQPEGVVENKRPEENQAAASEV